MANNNNICTSADTNTSMIVPVINKTEALFARDPNDKTKIINVLPEEVKKHLENEKYIVTAKTDGTCGLICWSDEGGILVMKRQDIKPNSRNFKNISKGKNIIFSGRQCFFTEITRGTGKNEFNAPFYIFQLDENGMPLPENSHIVGFTPIHQTCGEDQHIKSALVGTNGSPDLMVQTTVFNGSLDIPIQVVSAKELMADKSIMTVEIMGPSLCKRYGFKKPDHFINPHGSIIYPQEHLPPLDYDGIKEWFANDKNNRWADVEGFVIHFPDLNKRYKLHRGHFHMEKTWEGKTESGIHFIW